MRIPALFPQTQQGARHYKLYVVRMSGDSNDSPAVPSHSDLFIGLLQVLEELALGGKDQPVILADGCLVGLHGHEEFVELP
jgi:hypothetical protein